MVFPHLQLKVLQPYYKQCQYHISLQRFQQILYLLYLDIQKDRSSLKFHWVLFFCHMQLRYHCHIFSLRPLLTQIRFDLLTLLQVFFSYLFLS